MSLGVHLPALTLEHRGRSAVDGASSLGTDPRFRFVPVCSAGDRRALESGRPPAFR